MPPTPFMSAPPVSPAPMFVHVAGEAAECCRVGFHQIQDIGAKDSSTCLFPSNSVPLALGVGCTL
jgi:hypothetical protein